MSKMDILIDQLRNEMVELRAQSTGLTNQMWLLYVTFEDFVCLRHPNKQKGLLETSVDINTYVHASCLTPINSLSKSPISRIHCNNSPTNNQSCESTRRLRKGDKEKDTYKICEARIESSACEDKHRFDKRGHQQLIVSYQIARIQRLRKTRSKNLKQNNWTKLNPNGANGLNSMELGGAKRKNRQPDNMRDTSSQANTNNVNHSNTNRCVNTVDLDNGPNSTDFVSVLQNHSQVPLFRRCVSQENPSNTRHNDNSQRYNPNLNVENRNFNLMTDHSRPHCIRNPVRTGFSSQSSTRVVNVRALQAISDTVANQDPCITNKLSVQSKCWNQLRVQGILPCDNKNSLPPRLNISFDSASQSLDMSPKRLKHGAMSSSHQNVNDRVSNVSAMRTKPRTLSLEQVNQVSTPRSRKNADVSLQEGSADLNVSQCHSNDSSPVTISSGYESDSIPTCEADIDKIFTKHKNKKLEKDADMEPLTDYFSMSDSHPNVETPTTPKAITDTNSQPALPMAVVTRIPEKVKNTEKLPESDNKPKPRKLKPGDKDQEPTKFSQKARHNYQLTKLARSMFDIIDDLQPGDKPQEGRKKSRKPRKNTPPSHPNVNTWTDQNPPMVNQQSRVQFNSNQKENTPEQKKQTPSVAGKCDQVMNPNMKFSVKCLRRPLGQDPSDFDRNCFLPHSNSAVLPSYEEDTPTRCPQITGPEFFRFNSVNHVNANPWQSQNIRSMPPSSAPPVNTIPPERLNGNWTSGIKECTPYATTRLPGCQTPRRDPRDDHVYETIPGDEFLYEELLRMRACGIISKKFRHIPGFPGAFVPYEPPALPARNDRGAFMRRPPMIAPPPFLVMTDANANHTSMPDTRSSFCVSSTSNLNKQSSQVPKCRSRSASWDGYGSLDRFRRDRSYASRNVCSRGSSSDLLDCTDSHPTSPKRRENFYLLLNNKQKRADFSESLAIETKLKGLGFVWRHTGRDVDEDGYTTMDGLQPIDFQQSPQFLQSTYV